jgi:hypothetical protein
MNLRVATRPSGLTRQSNRAKQGGRSNWRSFWPSRSAAPSGSSGRFIGRHSGLQRARVLALAAQPRCSWCRPNPLEVQPFTGGLTQAGPKRPSPPRPECHQFLNILKRPFCLFHSMNYERPSCEKPLFVSSLNRDALAKIVVKSPLIGNSYRHDCGQIVNCVRLSSAFRAIG